MPKLKQPYDRYLDLKTLISGRCDVYDIRLQDILGCSAPTAISRRKEPDNYTLRELRTIGKKLNIPIDELRAAAIRY